MTTNQKTKPQRKATDTPEKPLTFHLYKLETPDITMCGCDYRKSKRYPLDDRKSRIPRTGYVICPLCALAIQIEFDFTDEELDAYLRHIEGEMLRKRYSA